MKIIHSLKTLGDLATRIKYLAEINDLAFENKEYINTIKHRGFYEKFTFQQSISTVSINFLFITVCSFLDEYEKKLTPLNYPNHSSEILILKKINSPAIRRIKKWIDLKNYRNTILAHNLVIKDKYIYSLEDPIKYNIPSNSTEIKLLVKLILIIAKNIGYAFPLLVNKIDYSISISDIILTNGDKIDFESEEKNILDKIEFLKKSTLNDQN